LTLYGQEINGQSYAICKSDMISKGQDIGNIRKGDTLIKDEFYRRTFDFCLSNPPYGVDWKAAEEFVKEEHRAPAASAGSTPDSRPSAMGRCCSCSTWSPRCVPPMRAAAVPASS
jgi:type I restriction-modification system DNA methylase subunit